MLHRLTGQSSRLEVLSVTGMAGIGKTTLTKRLYDHPFIMHHFYVRAWVTVSQRFQEREILLGIIRHIPVNLPADIYEMGNEHYLREQVKKLLRGKRYLIVLDDMWDKEAWDGLRMSFPDEKNGSRVMVTSRLGDVAVHASLNTPPHRLRFLSTHESWELLCSKIFTNELCPPEFVKIGTEIARKCRGLPLAIVLIGGLLSRMKRSMTKWEMVAENVGSIVMKEAELHCQEILALSYSNLPCYLKTCFLYMGIFLEDYDIPIKTLIMLWVAEGFIRPQELKSLEEVAQGYLQELISRSLIFVKRKGSDGRVRICGIHDIMREFCIRESQKENFLRIVKSYGQEPQMEEHDLELLVIEQYRKNPLPNQFNLQLRSLRSSILKHMGSESSSPVTPSFIFFETLRSVHLKGCLSTKFGLPKVLDILHIQHMVLPRQLLSFSQLRYVALIVENISHVLNIMPALQNVQTLLVDCDWDGHLSGEFWDMHELRHLHIKRRYPAYQHRHSEVASPFEVRFHCVSGPRVVTAQDKPRILKNLRSLSKVCASSCTMEIFISMPNLKSLGVIEVEDDCQSCGWLKNLIYLQELERLKYVFSNPFVGSHLKPDRFPSWDLFPPKLTKLTLSGTSFPWEDMAKISMLPKLKVLKLRNYAFSGKIWKTSDRRGFLCLRFLLIGSTDLEVWETDGSHFPSLQQLVLRHCRSLQEIPYGICESPLLEKIELHCCGDSAASSARQMQKEQENLGNDGLTVYITEK